LIFEEGAMANKINFEFDLTTGSIIASSEAANANGEPFTLTYSKPMDTMIDATVDEIVVAQSEIVDFAEQEPQPEPTETVMVSQEAMESKTAYD